MRDPSNGTHFDMTVGDDAHIVPKPSGISHPVEWYTPQLRTRPLALPLGELARPTGA